MAEMSCEVCRSLVAEIALGVLHGRERAEALAHLEHCPACQHELLLLGDLADRLIGLTPSAEPSAGFETRVLAALRAGSEPPAATLPAAPLTVRPAFRRRHVRRVVLVLAAASVAVVGGVSGWIVGHHDASPSYAPVASAGYVKVANLVADRQVVGQVVVTGGGEPWVYMAMSTTLGDRKVTCQLREQDGHAVTLGTFKLKDGSGYWAAPIPDTSSPVVSAQLVGAQGTTLATANVAASSSGQH
jgi:hypothetical protein